MSLLCCSLGSFHRDEQARGWGREVGSTAPVSSPTGLPAMPADLTSWPGPALSKSCSCLYFIPWCIVPRSALQPCTAQWVADARPVSGICVHRTEQPAWSACGCSVALGAGEAELSRGSRAPMHTLCTKGMCWSKGGHESFASCRVRAFECLVFFMPPIQCQRPFEPKLHPRPMVLNIPQTSRGSQSSSSHEDRC